MGPGAFALVSVLFYPTGRLRLDQCFDLGQIKHLSSNARLAKFTCARADTVTHGTHQFAFPKLY